MSSQPVLTPMLILVTPLLVLLLIAFAITWYKTLAHILGLNDEDFPGKNDKMIWLVVFFVIPILAPFLFSSSGQKAKVIKN